MKKKIIITVLGVLLAATTAHGSGYRIPEQSTNSIALAGAYIAHTMGPDTAYFNPAAMSWQEDAWQIETSLTYINLPSIKYDDNVTSLKDGGSKTENFLLPLIHVVSKDLNNFRVGFSLAYPAGLSKNWDAPFPAIYSKEFTLRVIEANPTIAYKVCDHFSIAAGLRLLHANGTVKNSATYPYASTLPPGAVLSRDLDGQTTEFGYNLALSLRPMENWVIGATYRSKVSLDLSTSDAELNLMMGGTPLFPGYNGHAEVSAPVPAVVSIGTSYTIADTTVEIAWDRTFWSKYDHLDFDYSQDFDIAGHPYYSFDHSVDKDWRNSDAYRIGLTHRCTDKFTAMLGFAIDSNPVPENNLTFELPDSDAQIYAIGGRYQYSEKLSIGASYFFYDKESRKVTNAKGINGEITDAGAHVTNIGINYKF